MARFTSVVYAFREIEIYEFIIRLTIDFDYLGISLGFLTDTTDTYETRRLVP